MNKPLRWTIRAAAATAALGVAAFAGGYASTSSVPVPRTVADDPALPSVTIDGVKLHVRTYGDPSSPPVIVVHGGPGNDARYLLPLSALSDRHRVIFYDQRGSGLSERVPDDELTLDAMYGELDGLVDRFSGGRPMDLVGHSWGAMLASGYAGKHPDKVHHLVLAEPGMLTSEDAKRWMDATHGLRPPASVEVARVASRAFFESLHVDGPDPDARRDYLMGALSSAPFEGHPIGGYFCGGDLRNARMEGWRFGARIGGALFGAAGVGGPTPNVDFVSGVQRLEHKVLFLSGSCNTIIGPEQQRRNLRHYRDAELVVIEGAGHTMFGEKPEESVAAVRRYLEDDSNTRASN